MQDIVTTNIDKFFESITTVIKNIIPWDFHIRLLLFLMALVLVLGIQRIYFNIKESKDDNVELN